MCAAKVPIFCSLIPAELVAGMGYEPYFLAADEIISVRPKEYHCAFHENLCSYSKALYDYFLRRHGDFAFIIVPTSCDAMKKLYNALREAVPEAMVHLLNVPQAKGELAAEFLAGEFRGLVKSACHSCGSRNPEKLIALDPRFRGDDSCSLSTSGIKIGVIGSNVPSGILEECAERFGFELVYLNHCIEKAREGTGSAALKQTDDGMLEYARLFLEKNSCPRTNDYGYKEKLTERIVGENFSGVIVNTLKFCDFQPFDYIYLRGRLGSDFPALALENELTANYEGQLMTRIEAFFERIKKARGRGVAHKSGGAGRGEYFVGIDSGSHATKLVCIGRNKEITARLVVNTGSSVDKSAASLMDELENRHGIGGRDIARIIATGYGRSKIKIADEAVTEITCHALGAHHILGHAATIIDIGGQDSKAIRIDASGAVVRFAMNDKCAAGTGRFLEVMAAKLEMSLEEFSELAHKSRGHVPISSMCSVFAESEVISLIASGKTREEIAKGIHRAIAERTISLARRIDGTPPFYMAGGVAKNRGLLRELRECLGSEITVLDQPQFSGALGAALMAVRS